MRRGVFSCFYAVLFDVVSFHVVAFCTVKSSMVLQLENFIHDIQIVEKVFPLVLLFPLTLWLRDEVTFFMFILFSLSHTTTLTCHVWFFDFEPSPISPYFGLSCRLLRWRLDVTLKVDGRLLGETRDDIVLSCCRVSHRRRKN